MKTFLTLILSVSLAWPESSMLFDADSERINIGSGSSLDNHPLNGAATILVWVRRTSDGANKSIFTMDGTTFGTRGGVLLTGDNSSGEGTLTSVIWTDADPIIYTSNAGVLPLNEWTYVAMVFNASSGAGELVQLYAGDRDTIATEITYSSTDDGTGTRLADAANDKWIGNVERASTSEFGGQIGQISYWSRALSLAEVQDNQFNQVCRSGCVYLSNPGFDGTGTQKDLSGNGNSGTVTGATADLSGPPIFISGGPL